jgi:glycine cleavage system aminomethyltransferase T
MMERLSGLHRCHLQAHASMKTFFDWQLPASYTDPESEIEQVRLSAGISDASYLTKLEIRGAMDQFPAPARVWKLTRAHGLVTSPLPITFAASPSITVVTSLYSAILLAGPRARQVLEKLTTLDVSAGAMPEGVARQARLAHVNAIILRSQDFFVLTTRDVAEHAWHALLHAGASPFGLIAQQQRLGLAHEGA